MSSVITIEPGGVLELDPSDSRTLAFDWDMSLRSGVAISTSAFTITTVTQRGATILTKDNEAKLTAAQASIALERTVSADNRATRLRLIATTATEGDVYTLENAIVTDESPTQTKAKSLTVLIRPQ